MIMKPFTGMLIASMLILAGCGGGSSSVVSSIDACALLTKADVEQILGQPVNDPTHPVGGSETFNVTSCEYQVQGGSPLDNASIIVTVPADGDQSIAQNAYDIGKQQA
jgi:hypothetical protein